MTTQNTVTSDKSPVTENETVSTEAATEATEMEAAQAHKPKKARKDKKPKNLPTPEQLGEQMAEDRKSDATVEHLTLDTATKGALDEISLPESEDDPHWDPKMRLPVPDSLVTGLAVNGWDPSMPLKVRRGDGGKLHIINGRTKFRAIDEANKRRKANKLPPLVVPVVVTNMDEIDAMGVAVSLNEHQQHIDPITRAMSVRRLMSAGYTEDKISEVHGIKLKQVQEYDALNDLPEKVKKLIASGQMAMGAALALTHLDAKKVEAAAERLAEQAASVGRVTAKEVHRNLNDEGKQEPDRLNAKGIKTLIDEVEKSPATALTGKHAEAVREAFVLALECVLDSRKVDTFWKKLDKIAAGK